MTEQERRVLRAEIDAARRERLAACPTLVCAYCSHEMPPHPSGQTKRFCSKRCRSYHWYATTDAGHRARVLAKRRRRRRQGTQRRPNAEVAL